MVDRDYSIKVAGGFIIQLMPGADELLGDLITYRLEEFTSVTGELAKGKTMVQILEDIFDGMDLKINNDTEIPKYKCDCSRSKVERALISIGYKDLKELYDDGKTEELKCQFCNKAYEFTHENIGELLKIATQTKKN